jgi:hypothetical protein
LDQETLGSGSEQSLMQPDLDLESLTALTEITVTGIASNKNTAPTKETFE